MGASPHGVDLSSQPAVQNLAAESLPQLTQPQSEVRSLFLDRTVRAAGMLVPVFALHSAHDMGIGDTEAMIEALEFCAWYKMRILQVLPINETSGDHSPYTARSSVALEPSYITCIPGKVPGLRAEDIQAIAPEERLRPLRHGPINYPEVKSLKLALLSAAFDRFVSEELGAESALAGEFSAWCEARQSWLPQYTAFRLMLQQYGGNDVWENWEPVHREYASTETWLSEQPEAEHFARERLFYSYVQWVAHGQWREVRTAADRLGVELMGDIPFGINRYSSDVWAERDLFDLEWSAGAPPEIHFQGDQFTREFGQNWGAPLYRWDRHVATGFAWWSRRVHSNAEIFHSERFDHAIGPFHVYGFPWHPKDNNSFLGLSLEQVRERTGGRVPEYKPHPDTTEAFQAVNQAQGERIFRALLRAAPESGLVAEDLGNVPPYLRPTLQKLGVPGFFIPQFERDEKGHYPLPEKFPELAVTTYNTHDHVPLRSFYQGRVDHWQGPDGDNGWREMQQLMKFLRIDSDQPPRVFDTEVHEAAIRTLCESRSQYVIFSIQDLLGSSERWNMPASEQIGNWTNRLPMRLAAFEEIPHYLGKLEFLRDVIEGTERGDAASRVEVAP